MFSHSSNTTIQLAGSPSLVLNNLSSSNTDNLTFIRSNEAFIVQISGESVRVPASKLKIYQASFVNICGSPVVAILSNLGVQIWSAHADNMMFNFPMTALFENDGSSSEEERFMRGVATSLDFLCVGSSEGSIMVFSCSSLMEGNDFPVVHNITTERDTPISALAATDSLLAAGSDSGKLFGYKIDEAFVEAFSFPGFGFPCTSLVLSPQQVLIAAYSSGHIRLYRTDIVELAVEITAHTRIVTGLALNPDLNLFISCGQDQLVHVWSLPDFRSRGGSEVTKLYSELLENKICTGVASLSKDRFAVACYDEDEITVFNLNK